MAESTPASPAKTRKVVKKVVRRVVKRKDGTIVSSTVEPHTESNSGGSKTSTVSPVKSTSKVPRRAVSGASFPSVPLTPAGPDSPVKSKSHGKSSTNISNGSTMAGRFVSSSPRNNANRQSTNSWLNNSSSSGTGGSNSSRPPAAPFSGSNNTNNNNNSSKESSFTKMARRQSTNTWLTTPSSPDKNSQQRPKLSVSDAPTPGNAFAAFGATARKSSRNLGGKPRGNTDATVVKEILNGMSPVILKRVARQVVGLQAVARGFLARRKFARAKPELQALAQVRREQAHARAEEARRAQEAAALLEEQSEAAVMVQKIARGTMIRLRQARSAQVIPLQALVRRYITQRRLIVPRLEHKLRKIEEDKQIELLELQEWSVTERAKLEAQYETLNAKWEKRARQGKSLIKETGDIAQHLRSENKRLREDTEKVRAESLELARQNKGLVKANAKLDDNIQELQKAIAKLEKDYEKFTEIEAAFRTKVHQYEDGLEDGKDLLETETSIRSLVQATAEEMVKMVRDRENDRNFARAIENAVKRDFDKVDQTLQAKTVVTRERAVRRGSMMAEQRQSSMMRLDKAVADAEQKATNRDDSLTSKTSAMGDSDEEFSSSSDSDDSDDDSAGEKYKRSNSMKSSKSSSSKKSSKSKKKSKKLEKKDKKSKKSSKKVTAV